VWRTDGQKPRVRESDAVIEELVQLRRLGFRFVALADDNFYPVTLEDCAWPIAVPTSRPTTAEGDSRRTLRADGRAVEAAHDMTFFTQITMEAAEDPEYLTRCRGRVFAARCRHRVCDAGRVEGRLQGLQPGRDALAERLQEFQKRGVHVLGSFIFGLPSDKPATFDATAALAQQANVTLAQFVMLTPFPGTLDFQKWEASVADDVQKIDGVPVTRHWLILETPAPEGLRAPHPVMSADEIRQRTQAYGTSSTACRWSGSVPSASSRQVAAGVRADLEAYSADACRQHRHLHRQRPLQ
jgi:hypothetical protein